MSRNRANISSALRNRRAFLLAEGRRRFYVRPLDIGGTSRLSSVPHDSFSDCLAAAHDWVRRALSEGCFAFQVIERAEMGHESVHASVREFLVFRDLLPCPRPSGLEVKGGTIRKAARSACRRGSERSAPPERATFQSNFCHE